MNKIIRGKAFVLGHNIDTDQIIPAEHLVYSMDDQEESKKYGHFALSGVPLPESGLPRGGIPFIEGDDNLSDYSIIVGASNFGCGSSREHAPYALMKAGAKAIIAASYARIFYRNAVDGGFVVPYESQENLSSRIKTGDELQINMDQDTLKNLSSGEEFQLNGLGSVLPIVEAGGLFKYARKTGMIPSTENSA